MALDGAYDSDGNVITDMAKAGAAMAIQWQPVNGEAKLPGGRVAVSRSCAGVCEKAQRRWERVRWRERSSGVQDTAPNPGGMPCPVLAALPRGWDNKHRRHGRVDVAWRECAGMDPGELEERVCGGHLCAAVDACCGETDCKSRRTRRGRASQRGLWPQPKGPSSRGATWTITCTNHELNGSLQEFNLYGNHPGLVVAGLRSSICEPKPCLHVCNVAAHVNSGCLAQSGLRTLQQSAQTHCFGWDSCVKHPFGKWHLTRLTRMPEIGEHLRDVSRPDGTL